MDAQNAEEAIESREAWEGRMVALLRKSLAGLAFNNEEQCIEAFYRAKWPQGFRCPRCGCSTAYTIATRRLPLYECASCGKQTSLIADTVLSGSRTPLLKWFQALYLHTENNGISAVRLSQVIGVTYKTAWLIGQKLRLVMRAADAPRKLDGKVLIVSEIYAQQFTGSCEWQKEEQPVLLAGIEDEQQRVVQMIIRQQQKALLRHPYSTPDFQAFIAAYVSSGMDKVVFLPRSNIRNRHPGLLPNTPEGQAQGREERARSMRLKHIMWAAHGWISRLHGGVGGKHLQAYLDHYLYLWHRRGQKMFHGFMAACGAVKATPYPILTGSRKRPASNRSSRPDRVSTGSQAVNA